ncbi:MAG TPA: hypothetical protein ENG92_04030 [Thiolapillus brandeum]|uniref:Uncharacterized protein n=1 Tax=Thiolapillus brandeum TaxID=1076588 RepID=A0A831K964_9GAMM|nr:hypothetical protein [Thiolapillus brandeum]
MKQRLKQFLDGYANGFFLKIMLVLVIQGGWSSLVHADTGLPETEWTSAEASETPRQEVATSNSRQIKRKPQVQPAPRENTYYGMGYERRMQAAGRGWRPRAQSGGRRR